MVNMNCSASGLKTGRNFYAMTTDYDIFTTFGLSSSSSSLSSSSLSILFPSSSLLFTLFSLFCNNLFHVNVAYFIITCFSAIFKCLPSFYNLNITYSVLGWTLTHITKQIKLLIMF
jgi:hypothetical protein